MGVAKVDLIGRILRRQGLLDGQWRVRYAAPVSKALAQFLKCAGDL